MDWNIGLPLGERATATTNAGTAVNVDSQKVPPGEVWRLNFAALNNESGENVSLAWAVVRGSQVIKLKYTAALATAAGDILDPQPLLFEGDLLRAVVTGSANSSLVTLLFTGWRVPLDHPAP